MKYISFEGTDVTIIVSVLKTSAIWRKAAPLNRSGHKAATAASGQGERSQVEEAEYERAR